MERLDNIMHSRESLELWLCTYISRHVDASIAVERSLRFRELGLDSLALVHLTRALSEATGREIPATAVWEYPSISELVGYVLALASEQTVLPRVDASGRTQLRREPIAVVGIACRFPGGAETPEAFWRMLCAGADAVGEAPRSRWECDALHSPDASAPGKMVTRRGGFLDQAVVEGFDAEFFHISPREALHMDPQQRIMLELAWEVLEDAGLSPTPLRGSPVGVFLGVVWTDYEALRAQRAGTASIGPYTVTGSHHSIVANRVSYTFGFQGPSLAVDTACSSSLVAVQLAIDSLRQGASSLAIAGGINLNIVPDSTIGVSKFGALSPDGRCYTFDERANGYVRGEGGGVVLLKPLSRAIADGDRVYCVLLDGAVNNNGGSNGLTAPNPQAQEMVLRTAYDRSSVAGHEVHYVELHGTGTRLGDPIEAKALGAALSVKRAPDRPLWVGSVKTNIGHLEAAAGVVGLIKLALSIHHRAIPASLNYETPNRLIPMAHLRLAVQRRLGAWPTRGDELATGGVSSFGFGGTNAHLVAREARLPCPQLFVLAAESEESLVLAAARHAVLQPHVTDGRPLAVICGEIGVGSQGPVRLAAVVRSAGELAELSRAYAEGSRPEGLHVGRDASRRARLAFVFSGQGSHWIGMGRSLLREEPVFAATLACCDAFIRRFLGWSLLDELAAEPSTSRLDEIEVTCPAIVAVEVALAALWRAWGVEPDMIVGHSIGEVAAAHVGGALSLEDAMRVICHHARTIGTTEGRGAMALAAISWEASDELTRSRRGSLDRAIHSSTRSSVLSGDPRAVNEVIAELTARGVFCRRIAVEVAAHSYQLEELRSGLTAGVAAIVPQRLRVPVSFSVTGGLVQGEDMSPEYWTRNLADPVLFSEAVDTAIAAGCEVFLEVSPHAIVKHAIADNLASRGHRAEILPTLSRAEDGRAVMLATLARLVVCGHAPHWPALLRATAAVPDRSVHILPLSARTPEALSALARRWVVHLEECPWLSLADACFTAATGRAALQCRTALVVRDRAGLLAELRALSGGRASASLHTGRPPSSPPRIAFLFPAHGAAPGAARGLYDQYPVFRAIIDRCAAAVGHPSPGAEILDSPQDSPQALFAVQVALAEQWRDWGVCPDVVFGHGVGEFAAATVARVLTLESAMSLLHAHARQEPEAFADILARTELSAPELALISGSDGAAAGDAVTRPEYWLRHLHDTATPAPLAALDDLGGAVCIDMGPGPGPDAAPRDPGERLIVASLRHDGDGGSAFAEALARLYDHGVAIDWRRFDAPFERARVRLPNYPWQRQRLWIDESLRPLAPANPPPAPTSARDAGARVFSSLDRAAAPEEAIAIIGIAGRFPGAPDLDRFWANLADGVDAVTEVPNARWDIDASDDPRLRRPSARHGGFIDGIDRFDPRFFDISPSEADGMDPQQRLFLEESWKALEDGGYAGARRADLELGVFVGMRPSDYLDELVRRSSPAHADSFAGTDGSALAGRIAHALDAGGPCLALDTAGSSSLVAIHVACESLRRGDADLALAGGVFIMTSPRFHLVAGQGGMLAPGGRCRAFDARAEGFVPADGVGVLLLRPLRAALAAGDTIHAVIRGSACNHDGRTAGLGVPSARAQERLIRGTYERCGIRAESISYVEAHGAGSHRDDPIEVEALTRVFRADTDLDRFCALGSVKTNVGHANHAAGVASALKALTAVTIGSTWGGLADPLSWSRRTDPGRDDAPGPGSDAGAWRRAAAQEGLDSARWRATC